MRDVLKACGYVAQRFLLRMREWCGDAAYERYRRAAVKKHGAYLLTAEQFYIQQLERKYSHPNRCC